ncbi:uncharacterized protein LOC129600947 [Paramacrobiotus metropolitanus]|uniref:uncharacterized protein LOC129600947 n=1 Tax=Paramacrobiotus metropolitanus TaxID=2943436 RepID=UPI0024462159|nr:uncharacterized protein LOC129600947 [Paramacrobiotus metropolitanus]
MEKRFSFYNLEHDNGRRSKSLVTVEELVHTPALMGNINDVFYDENGPALLSTSQKNWIADTVLQQLVSLHKSAISGIDFRPNNVLLSRNGAILNRRGRIQSLDEHAGRAHDEALRWLLYLAPEDLRGDNADERASDIWSFGCLCVYVFSGRDPQYYRRLPNGQSSLINCERNAFIAITLMVGDGICFPEFASSYQNNSKIVPSFLGSVKLIAGQRPSAPQLRRDVLLAHKIALLQCRNTDSVNPSSDSFTCERGVVAFNNADTVLKNSNMQYKFSLEDFIGRGSLGQIFLAKITQRGSYTGSQDVVAVKMIHSQNIKLEIWMDIEKKLRNLTTLVHEHLVVYHKVSIVQYRRALGIELAMDFYKESLASTLRNNRDDEDRMVSWKSVTLHAKDITQGLEFLHRSGMVHGNLKPTNIFFSVPQKGYQKLLIGNLECIGMPRQMHQSYSGRYLSPEMIRLLQPFDEALATSSEEKLGPEADIWSLGCIILDMAEYCGRVPKRLLVKGQDIVDADSELGRCRYHTWIFEGYVPFVGDAIDENLAVLIRQCFDPNPASRISASALILELSRTLALL